MQAECVVSLTFDDGWKSAISNAAPILDAAGVQGTFYVLTGRTREATSLSAEDIRSLHARGHEIGSHTVSHPHLGKLDLGEAEKEIVTSVQHLRALGIDPATFAYPYGESTPDIIDLIRQSNLFKGARGIETGFNTPSTDPYLLRCQGVRMRTPFHSIKRWIRQAKTHNQWLILMFHQVEPSVLSLFARGQIFGTTTSILRKTARYLNAHDIPVMTVQRRIQE